MFFHATREQLLLLPYATCKLKTLLFQLSYTSEAHCASSCLCEGKIAEPCNPRAGISIENTNIETRSVLESKCAVLCEGAPPRGCRTGHATWAELRSTAGWLGHTELLGGAVRADELPGLGQLDARAFAQHHVRPRLAQRRDHRRVHGPADGDDLNTHARTRLSVPSVFPVHAALRASSWFLVRGLRAWPNPPRFPAHGTRLEVLALSTGTKKHTQGQKDQRTGWVLARPPTGGRA